MNTSVDSIKGYLDVVCHAMGGKTNDLLLKYGRSFEMKPIPFGIRRGRMGFCYANAGRIAIRRGRFVYCEGLAVSTIGFPLPHAWVMDKVDGLAFDPTWIDGVEYFGLPIKKTFFAASVVMNKTWSVLGWPTCKTICSLPSKKWLWEESI